MKSGEKIRTLRKSKGLTQKELSELSGVAEITIRKYEAGTGNPKYTTLKKIAPCLEVSPWELTDTIEEVNELIKSEESSRDIDMKKNFRNWFKQSNFDILEHINSDGNFVQISFGKETYLLTPDQADKLPYVTSDLLKSYIRGVGKDITARVSDRTPM